MRDTTSLPAALRTRVAPAGWQPTCCFTPHPSTSTPEGPTPPHPKAHETPTPHHHDVVARHVRDLLVAHDAQVGAEEDDQGRPLVDVEPVLKGLCALRGGGGRGRGVVGLLG